MIYKSGGLQKKSFPLLQSDINQINSYFSIKRSFLNTSMMKYKFFINYINILTLFYKFVTFLINWLLFDHGICYFLKYSVGNIAPFNREKSVNLRNYVWRICS